MRSEMVIEEMVLVEARLYDMMCSFFSYLVTLATWWVFDMLVFGL